MPPNLGTRHRLSPGPERRRPRPPLAPAILRSGRHWVPTGRQRAVSDGQQDSDRLHKQQSQHVSKRFTAGTDLDSPWTLMRWSSHRSLSTNQPPALVAALSIAGQCSALRRGPSRISVIESRWGCRSPRPSGGRPEEADEKRIPTGRRPRLRRITLAFRAGGLLRCRGHGGPPTSASSSGAAFLSMAIRVDGDGAARATPQGDQRIAALAGGVGGSACQFEDLNGARVGRPAGCFQLSVDQSQIDRQCVTWVARFALRPAATTADRPDPTPERPR